MTFKKDGFDGQRAIVIPRSIQQRFCAENSVIGGLFITDIGYYPKARLHKRKRPQGAEQNILIYCVEGKGTVVIRHEVFKMIPGDYILIPHGIPHAYEASEDNPWTIYWCHFKGSQANALLAMMQEKLGSNRSSLAFLQERIDLFDKIYQSLERGYSSQNLTYVNLTFLHFLNTFFFSEHFIPGQPDKHADLYQKAIAYMQNNIDRELSLAQLAESVNLSISHFSSIFKKKTGFSPIEYFNQLKIQKACQYLQFTQMRIREIAFKVGIEDPFYFSRLFTKTMGYGPREYRDNRYSSNKNL